MKVIEAETTELELFDELKADIAVFVSPTHAIRVTDGASAQTALDAVKQIKALSKRVESQRVDLVSPLNDRVKLINRYVEKIAEPLEQAEKHLKLELNAYARRQEEIRQAEIRKAEEIRREEERKANEARIQAQRELDEKLAADRALANEAAYLFGAEDPEDFERQQREKELREKAELDARLERERIARIADQSAREYDANQNQIKNVRKSWKCRLLNIDLVPKEYVIRTLNEKAILAMARAGVTNIPGVEVYQDLDVAIGSNTYVPKKLIKGGE